MVAPLAMLGINLAAGALGRLADSAGAAKSSDASGQGGQDATKAAAAAKAAANDPHARMKKTAQDFETMFLENTFDRLTANGGQDGPLGEGGTGGDVYRSMLAKEYAGQVSKTGGVGISGQVYRQLLQLQEGAGHAGAA